MLKKSVSFFAGLAIFIVLPLAGWGLGDLQGFLSDTIRVAYLAAMFLLSLAVVLYVPGEGRGMKEGNRTVKRQKLTILALQIIPLLIVVLAPYCDRHNLLVIGNSQFIQLAGLIMTVSGFVLMNWSVMALGRQFSVEVTIQDDHKLITNGPYRYVRHPRYLGIVVFFSGIALVFRSWISLAAALLLLAVLIWRIRDEERLMKEEFGSRWQEYCSTTRALIPFIW